MYLRLIIMCPNCSVSSPLSQSQKAIWSLIAKGFSVSNIADKLSRTRQYVNQTKIAAETKLTTTLLDVAQANDLQITKLYPKEGVLLGYHPALKTQSHPYLQHKFWNKSMVLARQTRRSHRPSFSESNKAIPTRHS